MPKVVAIGTERQLELPLSTVDRTRTAVRAAGTARIAAERKIEERADATLRFPHRGKPTASPAFKPLEQPEAAHRFTVGGFLLGCAMGSAAAAMVLLVVQITVG